MYINETNQAIDKVCFSLSGEWKFEDHKGFAEIIKQIDDPDIKTIIIDTEKLAEITTPGIGCLLLAKEIADQRHKRIIITEPISEQVIKMFSISDLYKRFSINLIQ